jgi:hypothetical protein
MAPGRYTVRWNAGRGHIRRPDLAQVVAQDGELALVSSALQLFENPHGAQLRKALQQQADLRLVLLEAGRAARSLISRRDLACQRSVDRPPLKTEVAGNRSLLPTLRQIQPPDLCPLLHAKGCRQGDQRGQKGRRAGHGPIQERTSRNQRARSADRVGRAPRDFVAALANP